jgi:hypothetical protein
VFSAHQSECSNDRIEARQHVSFTPSKRREAKRHKGLLQTAEIMSAQSQVTCQIESAVLKAGPLNGSFPLRAKLLTLSINVSSKIKQFLEKLPLAARVSRHTSFSRRWMALPPGCEFR